jgi:excisionase family DNA binding protein
LLNDRYVPAKWVKDKLTLSNGAVYNLAHSGEVEVVRIGNSIRFSEASLMEWLDRQRLTAA